MSQYLNTDSIIDPQTGLLFVDMIPIRNLGQDFAGITSLTYPTHSADGFFFTKYFTDNKTIGIYDLYGGSTIFDSTLLNTFRYYYNGGSTHDNVNKTLQKFAATADTYNIFSINAVYGKDGSDKIGNIFVAYGSIPVSPVSGNSGAASIGFATIGYNTVSPSYIVDLGKSGRDTWLWSNDSTAPAYIGDAFAIKDGFLYYQPKLNGYSFGISQQLTRLQAQNNKQYPVSKTAIPWPHYYPLALPEAVAVNSNLFGFPKQGDETVNNTWFNDTGINLNNSPADGPTGVRQGLNGIRCSIVSGKYDICQQGRDEITNQTGDGLGIIPADFQFDLAYYYSAINSTDKTPIQGNRQIIPTRVIGQNVYILAANTRIKTGFNDYFNPDAQGLRTPGELNDYHGYPFFASYKHGGVPNTAGAIVQTLEICLRFRPRVAPKQLPYDVYSITRNGEFSFWPLYLWGSLDGKLMALYYTRNGDVWLCQGSFINYEHAFTYNFSWGISKKYGEHIPMQDDLTKKMA